MSDCKTDSSCDSNKGSCESGAQKSDDCCTMAADLLCLAKQAKHELLKERMKVIFEEKLGEKMDKVAAIVTDAAIACMEHKMEGKAACDTYKADLLNALKS